MERRPRRNPVEGRGWEDHEPEGEQEERGAHERRKEEVSPLEREGHADRGQPGGQELQRRAMAQEDASERQRGRDRKERNRA